MRSLRTIIKKRERILTQRSLNHLAWRRRRRRSERKREHEIPPVVWIINGHWSAQDHASAYTQGWCITRQHTTAPWFIRFNSKRGKRMFERGVKQNRRLACRALRVVVILALGASSHD